MLKLSADMRRSGVQPDVWTYASLIAACQSCGNRWREALDFYQDMQDKGARSGMITRAREDLRMPSSRFRPLLGVLGQPAQSEDLLQSSRRVASLGGPEHELLLECAGLSIAHKILHV